MTPEAECLLGTLRHVNTPAREPLDWQALLELADSHGVFMLFCRDFPGELPEEFVDRARSRWATSAFLASELEGLLQAFSRRGIAVIPLKGPVLASLLYGSPSLRTCEDLDLLVRAADLAEAEAVLAGLGFQSAYQADDYHHSFERGETVVELHFAVAPPSSPAMDLDVAWTRARVVDFRGQKTRFFAPPDLLMYLVIHGVKHGFSRMLWVLDAGRALERLDDDEVKEVVTMARGLGVEGALLTTCALAQLAFQVALPGRIAAAIAGRPAVTIQAAAMLETMLEGPASSKTTHQGAGIFLQLETSARGRWVQRLRLLRPSHQDYAWAERHKVHARWMPFLRPLRLVMKYGPGAAWRVLFSRSESTARYHEG